MKAGTRALGIAESFRGSRSTLGGAVVTPTGLVDGFVFGSCTVGGLDATDAMIDLWEDLDREDVQYCMVSGIAPAWYNIIDLARLADACSVPVFVLTYEKSDGLEETIREEFPEGADERVRRYRALPERVAIPIGDATVFVRSTGIGEEDVPNVVRSYTDGGARPEPVRVARLAARAADAWRVSNRSG